MVRCIAFLLLNAAPALGYQGGSLRAHTHASLSEGGQISAAQMVNIAIDSLTVTSSMTFPSNFVLSIDGSSLTVRGLLPILAVSTLTVTSSSTIRNLSTTLLVSPDLKSENIGVSTLTVTSSATFKAGMTVNISSISMTTVMGSSISLQGTLSAIHILSGDLALAPPPGSSNAMTTSTSIVMNNGILNLNSAGTGVMWQDGKIQTSFPASTAYTALIASASWTTTANGTNTSFGGCIAGSSVNFTSNGKGVFIVFSATAYNVTATDWSAFTPEVNGKFVAPGDNVTPWATCMSVNANNGCNAAFQTPTKALSAGSTSICVAGGANGGTWNTNCGGTMATGVCSLFVWEIP